MHEYAVIRDAIKGLGASLVEEHLHPESFGSAYAVFEGAGGVRFRFVWDGKEGYGLLQSPGRASTWHDVGPLVASTSNMQPRKFSELLSVAQTFIDGSAAL
jgi:hypothetical protein